MLAVLTKQEFENFIISRKKPACVFITEKTPPIMLRRDLGTCPLINVGKNTKEAWWVLCEQVQRPGQWEQLLSTHFLPGKAWAAPAPHWAPYNMVSKGLGDMSFLKIWGNFFNLFQENSYKVTSHIHSKLLGSPKAHIDPRLIPLPCEIIKYTRQGPCSWWASKREAVFLLISHYYILLFIIL